jgi:hypothetical protein
MTTDEEELLRYFRKRVPDRQTSPRAAQCYAARDEFPLTD